MSVDPSRRRFLRLAGAAGGAALAATRLAAPARAAGTADVLLLSCMDYRLMQEVERYMAGRGLADKYDHIVLAGAALGAVTDKYPAWAKTFWDHLGLALQLHQVHSLMVLDHRDCGAYKLVLGPEHAKDPATEKQSHAAQIRKLKAQVLEKHPKLRVEGLLMALDGKVESLA